ncbi:hypothetical protein [Clostridium lacusfryxellense]|uniref:hypothetical protein n=1 Tax=Clostridium lacusfryxellense TaxID=205328 RepID=UPI001C0BE4E6|nr:hypothetical protein [Clostridium lacusfryxellense]MBU3112120.1 hypothetical protein [Clostridium lacusfryxellense]
MAIAKMYGQCLLKALNKEVNLGNGATGLKLMLCTSAYVPNQETHIYKNSITNEVVGTGYTSGGIAISSVTVAYDGSTNTITVDGADITLANSTITARFGIIYDSTSGVATTMPLIAYIDFETDQISSNGSFIITFDANGIFTVATA